MKLTHTEQIEKRRAKIAQLMDEIDKLEKYKTLNTVDMLNRANGMIFENEFFYIERSHIWYKHRPGNPRRETLDSGRVMTNQGYSTHISNWNDYHNYVECLHQAATVLYGEESMTRAEEE